ncbi:MAG: tRNA (N6-isopentenyl adenosine(37)-C2)-methylthiotransferase MiaB, partial [Deferribacterales bacterium]|nr:tRNA (N6-isopentenyl adenosine(37)-C2)-methylthiotransferase MiaB [Deferribacterales bacterium]
MKIAFVTFGCKVNTSEDETFAADFALKGWQISKPDAADVVVINTCAVTETAAKRCASYMVGLKKKHPHLKIIAAGC